MNLCSTTHTLFTHMDQVISKQDFFCVWFGNSGILTPFFFFFLIYKDFLKTMSKTYGRPIGHEYATSWAASEQMLVL